MELNNKLTKNIEELCRTSCLSPGEMKKRRAICRVVEETLKCYYPNCQVFVFGSTLNGFGTKDSDVDLLFLPFPEYKKENAKIVSDAETKDIITPSLNDVDNGVFPKENLLLMDIKMQLSFVRKVLRLQKKFQKILYVKAKVPILRFESSYFKLRCDISCGNRQVLYNTELLKFFSLLDDRVQPLVMTLRHWAKSLNIINCGVLSSYSFTLMVIFFLQTIESPILPSVKHLFELSDSINIVDDWNVGFTSDLNKIKKSENKKPVGQLLKEFFMYYRQFNFAASVISVYSGQILSIESQSEDDKKLMKNFQATALYIQDPFTLSLNVGRHMTRKALSSFQQAFYKAFKIIKYIDHSDNLNKFQSLFDKKEYENLTTKLLKPLLSNKAFFSVDFNGEALNLLAKNEKLRSDLYLNASSALYELLHFGLLMDCEIIDQNYISYENASNKPECNMKLKHFLTIQCALHDITYIGRCKVKNLPFVECDFEQFNNMVVRKEYIISNFILQENPEWRSSQTRLHFICECYQSQFDYIQGIVIVLRPLTEYRDVKRLFDSLSHFVQKNLPKMLFETKKNRSSCDNVITSAPLNSSTEGVQDASVSLSRDPCNDFSIQKVELPSETECLKTTNSEHQVQTVFDSKTECSKREVKDVCVEDFTQTICDTIMNSDNQKNLTSDDIDVCSASISNTKTDFNDNYKLITRHFIGSATNLPGTSINSCNQSYGQ